MKRIIMAALASALALGCASIPTKAPVYYGSSLDEVEAAIAGAHTLVYETRFASIDDQKNAIALDGKLEQGAVGARFSGGSDPHGILFVFRTLEYGKIAYIRYKPLSGPWYSISIEAGEYQKPSFQRFGLMTNGDGALKPRSDNGLSGRDAGWTETQFRYKNAECIVMFELGFDGRRIVRLFGENGKYNEFVDDKKTPDVSYDFLFKIAEGQAELVGYKEFEI